HRRSVGAVQRRDFHLLLPQDDAANVELLSKLAVLVCIAGGDDDRRCTPVASVRRQSRQVGGHLGTEPAFRVEEDQQQIFATELRQLPADAAQIGEFEIRRWRTDGKAGCPALLVPSAIPKPFLDRLQAHENTAVLAGEVNSQPGSDSNQQPGEYGCHDEGCHRLSPCGLRYNGNTSPQRANRAPGSGYLPSGGSRAGEELS